MARLRHHVKAALRALVPSETGWVILLLSVFLTQFITSLAAQENTRNSKLGAAYSDDSDDFTEFDFDEEEFEGIPPQTDPRKQPRRTGMPNTPPSSAKPEQKPPSGERHFNKQPSTRAVDDEDESDEGLVEDEYEDDGVENEHDESLPYDDQDEFENLEAGRGHNVRQPKQHDQAYNPSQPLKFTHIPAHLHNNWMNFQVEIIMIFGLTIYLGNYIFGKTKNQTLATAWFDSSRSVLETNFTIVGDDGRAKEPSTGVLMKDSDCVFSLWCTGRSSYQGMLVQLKLIKRQDVVSLVTNFVKPAYDQVIFKISMTPEDMDSFVFAIGKRKTLAKLAKEMNDLYYYCTEKKVANNNNSGIPSSLTMLSEIGEASAAMLDQKVIAVLSKYEEMIDYIHVSDQNSGSKLQEGEQPPSPSAKLSECEKAIVLAFNVPGRLMCSPRHMEAMKPLLNFVFYFADKVKRFKLSREAKMKAEKNRQRVAESFLKNSHAARQEAAQARKEEKIRERKEKMLNEEDPEKQRRLEKQELKREAKRRQPKMKQLKIKAG